MSARGFRTAARSRSGDYPIRFKGASMWSKVRGAPRVLATAIAGLSPDVIAADTMDVMRRFARMLVALNWPALARHDWQNESGPSRGPHRLRGSYSRSL